MSIRNIFYATYDTCLQFFLSVMMTFYDKSKRIPIWDATALKYQPTRLYLDPTYFCCPDRKISNISIEIGRYPDGMKLGTVVPTYKKGPMYISDN